MFVNRYYFMVSYKTQNVSRRDHLQHFYVLRLLQIITEIIHDNARTNRGALK